MSKRLVVCAASVGVGIVLWSGVATAHVTVSPSSISQGTDDVILTFRVPNESTSASVTGLRIQFPLIHPIVLLNPEAGSGWQVSVQKSALPRPIRTDDGTFTSTVSEIDWNGGSIPVGQFGEFNVLAQGIPSGTDHLVFKAIQSYSDGTTVAWIQVPSKAVPDPPHPAPVITLTSSAAAVGRPAAAPAPATASGSGTGSNAESIAALILASFAVVLAVLAVWLGRPRLGERGPRSDGREEA
jgi:uncharacterized protein YcnI